MDPQSGAVKFFYEEYEFCKKLSGSELDRFLVTLLKRLEVVFKTIFTEHIIEKKLCKAFRALRSQKCPKRQEHWCDTLQVGHILFLFKTGCFIILSPSGESEEVDGESILNRFPFGDCLLTMQELVLELGLPSVMPSESRMRKYRFYEKVWSPKVQFGVEFTFPSSIPLSKQAEGTTKSILSKWIGSLTIPRKRKQMHT